MHKKEKWMLRMEAGDYARIGKENGVDPLLAKIMLNRGVKEEEASLFFHGTLEDLASPYQMKGMDAAVSMILSERERKADEKKRKIAIASDYDTDGLMSAYTLYLVFEMLGMEPHIYIPDRMKEGYGLNERIVRKVVEDKISLLVTCDNGIAALDAVKLAKELGLSVIVTDHHEVAFEEKEEGRAYVLPCADAILNPKQQDCGYPFKSLCGAGVVYRLAEALYEKCGISREKLYELTPFTAMATVADVMDLLGENRILVKEGLARIADCDNPGLLALIAANQLDKSRITAYHVGFILAPCFNAAGRLTTIFDALGLLMERNPVVAQKKAGELKALNDSRKEQTETGVRLAKEYIEAHFLCSKEAEEENPVYLIYLPGVHESIVGIVAGRIRESFHHPVFIFTDAEEGIKGSGRSIEAYNMFEEILKCKELLSHFGGHPMAAGLSLPKENFEPLRKMLNANSTLTPEDFVPVVQIDAAMPLGYITEGLVEELKKLEPFGKGNPSPLFAEQHLKLHSAKILGANKNVLKLVAENPSGNKMEAVYFGDVEKIGDYIEEEFGKEQKDRLFLGGDNEVDLGFVYYPDINEYRGCRSLQMVVKYYCHIKGLPGRRP